MTRYTFTEQKIYDILPNGIIRVYFDEIESVETINHLDIDTGNVITETYPIFTYRIADATSMDYTSIFNALLRAEYSLDDEIELLRQKDNNISEYNIYNAYIEKCKAIAHRIIDGDTLEVAKNLKIANLCEFDASDNVNSFTIDGISMWLSPSRRSNLKNAVEALKAQGIETITFIGKTISVDNALAMLSAIESYAAISTMVTDNHKIAINALETKEAVAAYDFTIGYPEKLSF